MSIVLGTEHFFHRAYTKKVAAFTTIFRKVSQNIYFFQKNGNDNRNSVVIGISYILIPICI